MAKIRLLDSPKGTHAVFTCPGCKGKHVIGTDGKGTLWTFNGDVDAPSFEPSILVNGPGPYHVECLPVCHSYVKAGQIIYLVDCSHSLAGQTVDLPEV